MIHQEIAKHFVMYVGLTKESHSWTEHLYSSDMASLVIKNGHPKKRITIRLDNVLKIQAPL